MSTEFVFVTNERKKFCHSYHSTIVTSVFSFFSTFLLLWWEFVRLVIAAAVRVTELYFKCLYFTNCKHGISFKRSPERLQYRVRNTVVTRNR
jgi:hypothetical protein